MFGPDPEAVDAIDGQGDRFLVGFPNTPFTEVTFGNPVTVANDVDFGACSLMTSLVFSVLVAIGGNLSVTCNVLTHFSAPSWLPTNGSTIDLSGCALAAESVNHILARCVAAGVTTCTINVSGGTNAAPTEDGVADKAALILAGNSVTTN